jgi:NAD(P)-dependent dehydrogenase (short-subunit alcohol dehydrogenase family)
MATFDASSTAKDVVAKLGSRVDGKTLVVTGPSPGSLGAELITELAAGAKPAKIILIGRNEAKTTPVIDNIKKANPSVEVSFVQADLADNSSVRKAAEKIKSITGTVDVLVNCAGIMGVREYKESVDGVEVHFAANHLGHFLLTNLLVDELAAAKGRVVNVTSMGYMLAEVDTEDPNFEGGKAYKTWPAYARSKTANILFSHGIAAKWKGKGITAVAADPGRKLLSLLVRGGAC